MAAWTKIQETRTQTEGKKSPDMKNGDFGKKYEMATKKQSNGRQQRWAVCLFGGATFIMLLSLMIFGPHSLPPYKHHLLAFFVALLTGLFGYFLTGTISLRYEGDLGKYGKVAIRAGGGAALFLITLWWWNSQFAPVSVDIETKINGIQKDTQEIRREQSEVVGGLVATASRQAETVHAQTEKITDQNRIIRELQEALSLREATISNLSSQEMLVKPSEKAKEIAAKVDSSFSDYGLALKAIAESRFDEARRLLAQAENRKLVELGNIYWAYVQLEMYSGHYQDALPWLEKLVSLNPNNPSLWNEIYGVYLDNARYVEAEKWIRKYVEYCENAKDCPPIPGIFARCNLARLYHATNRLSEAEPLYRQGLESLEKTIGPNTPEGRVVLNNLAQLLRETGRSSEAEPMMLLSLRIAETKKGLRHPDVAVCLNNLAQLRYDQGRFFEAESMMRQALSIAEEVNGKEHPNVAVFLNNLARVLQATNRISEAEDMYRTSIKIIETLCGPDHPDVAAPLNNMGTLFRDTNRIPEAELALRRALAIRQARLGKDHPLTHLTDGNLRSLEGRTGAKGGATSLSQQRTPILLSK